MGYTRIRYCNSRMAWKFETKIKDLILQISAVNICEIGGGCYPLLSLEYIQQNHINYTILDISEQELSKAPQGYNKIVADICNPNQLTNVGKFDLIFSQMLAEHVPDGKSFHNNIYNLLVKGGVAFHFFPTLYATPFILNRIIPETLSSWLIAWLTSRKEIKRDKFPAVYSWCRGPTKRQINNFTNLGYEIVEYIGWFGHEYYYYKLPIILAVHRLFTGVLLRFPTPLFTSFAYVTLQKP